MIKRLYPLIVRAYRGGVLWADRQLRLSQPHSLHCHLPQDVAYDAVVSGNACCDYDDNPFRLRPDQLDPVFPTADRLRRGWFLRGRFLPDGKTFQAAYHHAVMRHFISEDATRFLEIGAGSGNLSSFFHEYDRLKVTIVDLPSVVAFSSTFLSHVFPEATMLLPHEAEGLPEIDVDAYDFVMLTPGQLHRIPSASFDVACNIHSMQEMTQASIKEYFSLVERVLAPKGIWCNNNRVEKVPSHDALPVRACRFPYSQANEVLVDEVCRFTRLVQPDACVLRLERRPPP